MKITRDLTLKTFSEFAPRLAAYIARVWVIGDEGRRDHVRFGHLDIDNDGGGLLRLTFHLRWKGDPQTLEAELFPKAEA